MCYWRMYLFRTVDDDGGALTKRIGFEQGYEGFHPIIGLIVGFMLVPDTYLLVSREAVR